MSTLATIADRLRKIRAVILYGETASVRWWSWKWEQQKGRVTGLETENAELREAEMHARADAEAARARLAKYLSNCPKNKCQHDNQNAEPDGSACTRHECPSSSVIVATEDKNGRAMRQTRRDERGRFVKA